MFQFEQRTRHGYVPVGDLEQCIHYKVGKLCPLRGVGEVGGGWGALYG